MCITRFVQACQGRRVPRLWQPWTAILLCRHCSPAGEDFGPGAMTFTAANGDELFATYTGSAPFPGPGTDVVEATSHATVEGGTGRFEGATGHIDLTATITFQGLDDMSWPAT